MDKWMWALVSLGSIFIVISATSKENTSLMFMGLLMYAAAGVGLIKFYRDKKK